jgi:RimJ/RimL family protein N-acetyltransferase
MYWCHENLSIGEIKGWIDSRPQMWENDIGYHFAIIDSSNGSFLGHCGLDHIDLQNKVAELGYWVTTGRTNQGIATSASKLVCDFAFNKLKFNRVEIVIAKENAKSQRVAEKLGAQKEGLLRRRLNVRGTIHDAYIFSVIRDDLSY